MFAVLLPLDDAPLQIQAVHNDPDVVVVILSTTAPTACCPLCQHDSARVHSRYQRTLLDLPLTARAVRLHLQVRRFFCRAPDCPRAIFTERLPTLTRPYAHRTTRLAAALLQIGLALGGKAGARLAQVLHLASSPDTLLRLVRRLPAPPPATTPRVIGIDDWAQRKGQTYGTIICDLETRTVVDLLPDREAATVATWLQQHPGVEVISRDRAGAYAEGARLGAPAARQVADRFHLLKNLGDALAELLSRLYPELCQRTAELVVEHAATNGSAPSVSQPAQPAAAIDTTVPLPTSAAPAPEPQAPNPPLRRRSQQRARDLKAAHRTARVARFEEVRRLRQLGWSQRAIGQQLGLSAKTIRRWLSHEDFPEYRYAMARPSKLDGYKPYLDQRFAEGCHNARQLWDEVRAQGYRGGCTMVREYLAGLRGTAQQEPGTAGGRQPGSKLPRPGQLKWLLLRPISEVDDAQYELIQTLCRSSKEVTLAYGLVMDFQDLVRSRQADQLSSWVEVALASGVAEMVGFARGVLRDFAAVLAGLAVEWSQGQVEGQVNRLKMVKRTMYGRAKFDLLRLRVLYAH